jgi:hypothetical protein
LFDVSDVDWIRLSFASELLFAIAESEWFGFAGLMLGSGLLVSVGNASVIFIRFG